MELNAGWVGAGAGVVSLVGGALVRWVDNAITSVKATQKLLFDKHDKVERELQDYKLHVAETYVNREVLREQLLPINEGLKEIRDELRQDRKDRPE
jgi:phosphopantothenate synthetase